MKNLLKEWPAVKKRIKDAEKVLLLLDYDGTLSRIASRPHEAVLEKELKKRLVLLSRKENITVGIVSGRRLDQLKRLVGVCGIYYAGNHGLRINGPGIRFLHPACRRFNPIIKKIKKSLKQRIKGLKGVIIEDKRLTITVHYRLVKKGDLARLKDIFEKICAPYISKNRMKVSSGKKSWEIRPPVDWNKGNAVKRILADFRSEKVFPIYMGDDLTDEDAFRALKKVGLAVFIGKPPAKTNAEYNLRSVSGVRRFLKELYECA